MGAAIMKGTKTYSYLKVCPTEDALQLWCVIYRKPSLWNRLFSTSICPVLPMYVTWVT